jgi:uncharacterized protein
MTPALAAAARNINNVMGERRAAERIPKPPMTNEELLLRAKAALLEAHGARLQGVVLYGSQARGDYHPDSDIDLLVLLQAPIRLARDLLTNLGALYPLSLELGRPISAAPVDVVEYEQVPCPLYDAAHQEGIAA